tara:strand:- start:316 stop:996 length:681 start_codon:yes stop_codon:yes gene_type:complete
MNQVDFFTKVVNLLNDSEIDFWLCFGSVLAAVRNKGKFIDHDKDLDIGIWDNDLPKLLDALSILDEEKYTIKLQKGFHLCEDMIQLYCKESDNKKFHVDFYIFRVFNNDAYCRNIHFPSSKIGKYYFTIMVIINKKISNIILKKTILYPLKYFYEKIFYSYWFVFPKDFFINLSKVSFENKIVKIPENAIDFLEYSYGSSWEKPNKNWNIFKAGYTKKRRLSSIKK